MHGDDGYKCSSYQQTFWFFDYLYHVFQTYQFIKVHAICISSKVLPNAMLFLHARLYQNCPIILIFLSLIQFFKANITNHIVASSMDIGLEIFYTAFFSLCSDLSMKYWIYLIIQIQMLKWCLKLD